jgi:hypothetical protein
MAVREVTNEGLGHSRSGKTINDFKLMRTDPPRSPDMVPGISVFRFLIIKNEGLGTFMIINVVRVHEHHLTPTFR